MDKIIKALKEEYSSLKTNKARIKLANKYDMTIDEFETFIGLNEESDTVLTDIVIAFDTTGSMSAYIESVKKYVTELIPELISKNPNLQVSIVAFGDYCDMESKDIYGKAYQVIDLTSNENELIKFVKNARNTSGGDGDEFYELVLQKIRLETSWRDNSNKSILLIADCQPHQVGYKYKDKLVNITNQIDWKQEARLLADNKIKVDTLSIKGEKWYETLSEMTNGVHLLFKSSEKTSTLLGGYVNTRSGNIETFNAMYAAVEESGDEELIGVYKKLSTL